MKEFYDRTSDERYKPDATTYASVIDTFARNGRAFDAERILKGIFEGYKQDCQQVKPDLRCFNAVLNAWASISQSNREAAKRAETILELMQETSKIQGYSEIKPDKYAYNTVLKAYSNSGLTSKSHSLLQTMISTTNQYDAVSFNTVIDAYSKKQRDSKDNIAKALGLYKQMYQCDINPNVYTITSLLNVYANSGEKDAAKSAQEFLHKVEEEGEIYPLSTPTYNAVMNAWAKSRDYMAPQYIEKIIKHMEQLFQSGANVEAKPNTVSYSILANAWARSRTNAFRAQEILGRFLFQDYTISINDCFFR